MFIKLVNMSISTQFLSNFQQNLISKKKNKERYGEVFTNFSLIDKMLDLLPQELFQNPNLKWLDPCAGTGYFMNDESI
jgi:site-specific DNA-methyltransferase (adenine-specific)